MTWTGKTSSRRWQRRAKLDELIMDQAAPADAIGVLGAAEYNGRPSPVYRARLDHALELYHRGIAPLIITLGGPGGDQFTEGSVGEGYLINKGVPEQAIIAETESRNTEESARRIARHRPCQRAAPAGCRQRRHSHVPHSRHLCCRRS